MATHTSVPSFAGSIQRISKAIDKGQKDTLMAAALIMKDHITDELKRDVGSDLQMRNVGSVKTKGVGGAKLGVGFNVKGVYNPTALFSPRGPVALNEYGARPHSMPKGRIYGPQLVELDGGKARRGGSKRRKPYVINGAVRSGAFHPGTRGKGGWARGKAKGTGPAVERMRKSMVDIVKRGAYG